jgi:NADPH:quinone reductase-like Zn-dependent oxidoreductase
MCVPAASAGGRSGSRTALATGAPLADASGLAAGAGAVGARRQASQHPAGLSFQQAAVVAVSGVTALQGLRDAGHIQPGQKVLVIGASGGVGTYAVQLAKAFGAQVTGVCSTTKVDLVRTIGADHVIDYTREDFADAAQRYDLILDIGGNSRLSRLRRALAPKGTLVIVGGEQGGRWTGGIDRQLRALALSPFLRQRLTMFIAKQHHADLEALRRFIEAGQVTPIVGATYPLAEVPDAVRHLEAGHARGKLAITI